MRWAQICTRNKELQLVDCKRTDGHHKHPHHNLRSCRLSRTDRNFQELSHEETQNHAQLVWTWTFCEKLIVCTGAVHFCTRSRVHQWLDYIWTQRRNPYLDINELHPFRRIYDWMYSSDIYRKGQRRKGH